jgi:exodeoxyribonuclease VII large subunit
LTQRALRIRGQRLTFLIDRLSRQDTAAHVAAIHRRLQSADQRLHRTMTLIINPRLMRLNRASAGLEALSPLAVMSRGYALVYGADDNLLRSVAATTPGQTIRVRLAQGALEAEVTRAEINEANVMERRNL